MTKQTAPATIVLVKVSNLGKGLKVQSGVVNVVPSTDSGNAVTLGSDGGLYASGGSSGSGQATPNYSAPITSGSTQVIY